MTVEPMTDAELAELREQHAKWGLSTNPRTNVMVDRLLARLDAERTRADAAEAERDQHATAYIELHGQHVAKMIELADARSALKRAEAERDAAVARVMPEPRLLRTVEEVEALPGGHFYLVRRPWDARAMPWACLAVGSHKRLWRMLGSTVRSGCGALVGALISGPLPDLPTPTAAQEGQGNG